MAQLRPYKNVLRNLGRRRHSVKNVVNGSFRKKAEARGKVLTTCYVNVLDDRNNAKPCHVGQPFARRQPGTRGVERELLLLEA